MEGYIPISRKIFNHPFWKEERVYSFFEAWLDMIRTAKYNAETVLVKGRCLSIPRGDLVASVRYLANRWNWHRGRVERFLKMLKEQDMIKTRTETGISIISILNYDTYNRTGDPNETATGTAARQSRDSDRTKINKVNKVNKDNKVNNKANALCRVPYDFIYESYAKFCPSLKQVRIRDKQRDAGARRLWGRCGGSKDPDKARGNIEIYFKACEAIPFLRGEKPSETHPNWKADFNFVTREGTITKIMEGGYDN